MREISTEELKRIQIEILDDVVAFCKQHNLRYYLAYGTLLGAVRHGGYIPWDDDIDIHIPRPDYEKFLELYNSANSINQVVSHELEQSYRVPFAKVYRKGTIVKEFHFKPDVFGVYIDIFPIDGLKDERQAHQCGEIRRYMHVKNSIFTDKMTLARKIRLAITKIILLPVTLHKLQERIRKTATQRSYEESNLSFSSYSRLAAREIFPRAIFDGYKPVTFEGKEYRAPIDCDCYLKALYGNYMELPPKEKQISTHNSQAYYID